MALRHKYTLICDDVRVEINNKLFIIGVYGKVVTVPQLPFVFPSLTFVQFFESDRPEQLQFRASLQHLDSGAIVAQAIGVLGVPHRGHGVSVVRFQNVVVNQAGGYVFAVNLGGSEEPLTDNFDVVLRPAQVVPSLPTPPPIGGLNI